MTSRTYLQNRIHNSAKKRYPHETKIVSFKDIVVTDRFKHSTKIQSEKLEVVLPPNFSTVHILPVEMLSLGYTKANTCKLNIHWCSRWSASIYEHQQICAVALEQTHTNCLDFNVVNSVALQYNNNYRRVSGVAMN